MGKYPHPTIIFAGANSRVDRMLAMQGCADGRGMYAYEITHFEATAEGEMQMMQEYGGQAEMQDITAAIAAACMPTGGEFEEVPSTPSEEGITIIQPPWKEEQQAEESEEADEQRGEENEEKEREETAEDERASHEEQQKAGPQSGEKHEESEHWATAEDEQQEAEAQSGDEPDASVHEETAGETSTNQDANFPTLLGRTILAHTCICIPRRKREGGGKRGRSGKECACASGRRRCKDGMRG